LVKKDQEMQEFLDRFDERKQTSQKRNQASQDHILELLAKIQQMSKHDVSNMPSQQEYKSLNNDLNIKEVEMKRAEQTADQLLAERDARLSDLEKVGQLEVKLAQEVNQLSIKMESMRTELSKMDNVEEYKSQTESQIQQKTKERAQLKIKNETLRSEIVALTAQYDAKRNQLLENETFTHLTAQEQKIKQLESVVFELRDCTSF
jgi:intraflagellar transport protein 74